MANNNYNSNLRNFSWIVGTIMVLYSAMAFGFIASIYQRIFKPCKK
jgi:hypothetical protein